MKKEMLGIWTIGIVLLLFFYCCCFILLPEIAYDRNKNEIEWFNPEGIWTRHSGDQYSNFYFQLTEKGVSNLGTRYTVYHLETEIVPAAAEMFCQTDIWSTQVLFTQAPCQRGITLSVLDSTVQCPSIQLQPLDADHILLSGEAELEGIYTRQRSISWQFWSDWYLVQLYRWAELQGIQ